MYEHDTGLLSLYIDLADGIYKCSGILYTTVLTKIQLGLYNCFEHLKRLQNFM